MTVIDTIRAECQRRLSAGQDGVYLTLNRAALPTGNPRLLGRKGPRAIEVCNVTPDESGGYVVTCIFKASAILRFLDAQVPLLSPRN